MYTDLEKKLFTSDGNVRRYLNSDIIDEFKLWQCCSTNYVNGYGHGSRTHDECITLTTHEIPSVKVKGENMEELRIRKLTPLECLKLQGFSEEDYNAIKSRFNDSAIYHCAGDSISISTQVAMFGECTNLNYRKVIYDYVETLKGDYE